jgi:hypothetical protein
MVHNSTMIKINASSSTQPTASLDPATVMMLKQRFISKHNLFVYMTDYRKFNT